MKQLKIEDGIPVPARWDGLTDALRKLKVGQSFLLSKEKRNTVHASAFHAFGKRGHIATRSEGDNVRVWRIK